MEGIYNSAVISSALAFHSAVVPCILYQGTWGDRASLLFAAAWLSCWYSHRNPTCISTSMSGAFLFWPRHVSSFYLRQQRRLERTHPAGLAGISPGFQCFVLYSPGILENQPLQSARDRSLSVKQITHPSLQTTEVKTSVLFQLWFP